MLRNRNSASRASRGFALAAIPPKRRGHRPIPAKAGFPTLPTRRGPDLTGQRITSRRTNDGRKAKTTGQNRRSAGSRPRWTPALDHGRWNARNRATLADPASVTTDISSSGAAANPSPLARLPGQGVGIAPPRASDSIPCWSGTDPTALPGCRSMAGSTEGAARSMPRMPKHPPDQPAGARASGRAQQAAAYWLPSDAR